MQKAEYKKPLASIVILDFNRKAESELLMQSLSAGIQFPHEIVYVSNGGDQDYPLSYYNSDKINTLILNRKNEGCGIATRRGIQSAIADYVFYIQVDQILRYRLDESFVMQLISLLESDPSIFCIDLSGDQGHGNYSERAHFIKKSRYINIPNIDNTIGGPGPYAQYQWTENLVQQHVKNNNLKIISLREIVFLDNGGDSVRQNPDGSKWKHFTDTKQLYLISGPVKEKFCYPKFTDEEWDFVLKNQSWPDGKIPEQEIHNSFEVWHKK